eukprot:4728766-Pleurochrysis_carterae.AAC.3
MDCRSAPFLLKNATKLCVKAIVASVCCHVCLAFLMLFECAELAFAAYLSIGLALASSPRLCYTTSRPRLHRLYCCSNALGL